MTFRTLLAVALLLVASGCAGLPLPAPSGQDSGPAPAIDGSEVTVVRVVDGDTMDVEFANGSTERVRLLGVDTPEVYTAVSPEEWEGVPDTPSGRACLENWGDRASQYATEELAGKTVTLVIDPKSDTRDRYGRLLAYLAYEGTTFNRRLIETGHARMYDSRFSKRDEFAALERAAMENGTGAWACRTPTDGGDGSGGDSDAPVSISVHPDADGSDGDNLNDEYVTLTNTGDTELDLEGWTLSDAAGHAYEFGDVTLAPGDSITVHTGSGTDTETDVYWGSKRPVWNNDGDTVVVQNASGSVVAETSY